MASADETIESPSPASGGKLRELAAGSKLGKYRLERVLGSGGMGVVWAAHDPDLDRAVALKVLRYETASPELRTRLLREARAMAKLKHPNVLTVYAVDSVGDRDFIAMELVDGTSLEAWLATKPARDDIWQAILAAGHGLAAAHQAGLVHRDFKPHNVLRSIDGRVLVTDFGLARGNEEAAAADVETALPLPASGLEATAPISGSPLEGPLTRTGVLIGTPAYMAPEQFLGRGSDSRTDQFAYCVTAWQLFTGERPFEGTTVEELVRAVSAGVEDVHVDMPRGIRRVLARGLDPKPENRWPDMKSLLAALERAKAMPLRIRNVAFGIAVAGLAIAALFATKREPAPAASAPQSEASSTCKLSPEDEFAKAVTAAGRERVLQLFDHNPTITYAVEEVEAFETRWVDAYRRACNEPAGTRTYSKLSCLLGERDELAWLTELIPTMPKAAMVGLEMSGVLPRIEACEGDTPVATPAQPADPSLQQTIKKLRKTLLVARLVDDRRMFEMMPGALAEAVSIGWEPLIAEAHQAFAVAANHAKEQWLLVRDHYRECYRIAQRSHYDHVAADCAVGLLEGELDAATDVASDKDYANLVDQAKAAARNAGNDPFFLGRILKTEGSYAECRDRFDDAIANLEQARALEIGAHEFLPAIRYTTLAALMILRRGRADAVDHAWRIFEEMTRLIATRHIEGMHLFEMRRVHSGVAAMRGDLVRAYAIADEFGPATLPKEAVALTGKVVDANGTGVAGARVVAWVKELFGSTARVNFSSLIEGDIATTGADGSFTIRGRRDGGIIAGLGDQRSQPRLVGDKPLVLTLAPTRTISGRVACDDEAASGIVLGAHYQLSPTVGYTLATPVSRSLEYKMAGIPAGDATLRLFTEIDLNHSDRKLDAGPVRDNAPVRWPVGPSVDGIIRGRLPSSLVMMFLFRGNVTAKTFADIEKLKASSSFWMSHQAFVIGIGDQSPEVMAKYLPQDRHGVFSGVAPGPITICASAVDAPTAAATCKPFDVTGAVKQKRDGQTIYSTMPAIIER
jgi:predicted Ser/Thr protein kinase